VQAHSNAAAARRDHKRFRSSNESDSIAQTKAAELVSRCVIACFRRLHHCHHTHHATYGVIHSHDPKVIVGIKRPCDSCKSVSIEASSSLKVNSEDHSSERQQQPVHAHDLQESSIRLLE
jgi:hypothetical protein